MKQSSEVAKLMDALAIAQKNFKPVPKSKTGQEGNRKFKYADLADVVNMVTPILNAEHIFLSQPIDIDSNGHTRQTTRLQLRNEFIQTDGVKLTDETPGKNLGISVTYARRIDLNGLLGIAPDEDLDAPDLKADSQNGTPKPIAQASGPTFAKGMQTRENKAATIEVKDKVNPEITDDDFPPEFFEDGKKPSSTKLSDEDASLADELGKFTPLKETRNTEIQNYLKELVTNKTVDRRKLSLFLDREHGGKKSFDVSADKWEATLAKIKAAVEKGPDGIKAMLKGE